MIKKLRRKFVLTAMTAVTLLIIALLGAVNIGYTVSSSKQNERVLDAIVAIDSRSNTGIFGDAFQSAFDGIAGENRGGFWNTPLSADTATSSLYFRVDSYADGAVVEIDPVSIKTKSKEELRSVARKALSSGKSSGKSGAFIYDSYENPYIIGRTYIFLDVSASKYSVMRAGIISVLMGAAGWGLMLILMIIMSDRAIKPYAENIERQKRFVTDAGHELKTPLAIISANNEAMEMINGENKWTKNIREQTGRLSMLMQNLLVLARAGEQNTEQKKESVDFSALVETTAGAFEVYAGTRGIEIVCSAVEGVTVFAVNEHLTRIVSILFDNAVKYSAENSRVECRVYISHSRAWFEISNTVPPETEFDAEKIFDRFYRGDKSRAGSGGFGIGLAAAKAITEVYSGNIYAVREGDRVTFRVGLPRK